MFTKSVPHRSINDFISKYFICLKIIERVYQEWTIQGKNISFFIFRRFYEKIKANPSKFINQYHIILKDYVILSHEIWFTLAKKYVELSRDIEERSKRDFKEVYKFIKNAFS